MIRGAHDCFMPSCRFAEHVLVRGGCARFILYYENLFPCIGVGIRLSLIAAGLWAGYGHISFIRSGVLYALYAHR